MDDHAKAVFHYGNTGSRVFKQGVQNYKDFCLRINILKGNYGILSFEFWINGELSKSAKNLTFKVNFLCQKSSKSFQIFFSFKNMKLGAQHSLMTLFV